MTKTTKKAFFTSLLSLLVCFVMLIGSTFAWFTDSVTSGSNKIVAGNLDVALKHTNAKVSDQTVEQATDLFVDANGNAIKWEPGAMTYETFTIANEGTLALKYMLKMNVSAYNKVAGTSRSLLDVLKVKVLTGEDMIASLSREAVAELDWTASQTLGAFEDEGNLYPAGNADGKDTQKVFQVIVYWQPTANDNQWNVKPSETADGNALYVDFGVALVAAQLNYERDSFGPDYDQAAEYPVVDIVTATISSATTEDLTIASTGDIKAATVSAGAANAVFEEMKTKNADSNELALTLNVTKTGESTTSSGTTVALEIDMTAVMSSTTAGVTTVISDNITSFSDYVTIDYNLGTGLANVTALHKGNAMVNSANTDDDEGNGIYVYDATIGILTIKTKTLSPFTIEYKNTYVARIGSKGYKSLDAALEAATAGDTIAMLSNVTSDDGFKFDKANATIRLDLNGKTITVNSGSNVNSRAFRIDNGTLKVYNGTVVANGSGTTSANGQGCYGAFRVEANGVLYASNLTTTNARPWGLNVKVCGGEAYLNNVTIDSSYGGGIEVTEATLGGHSKAGVAELTDCTFTQTGYFDHCSSCLSVSGGSQLTINSGSYTSDNYALYVFSSGGHITVNGGTFSGAYGDNDVAIIAAIDTNSYPEYTGGLKLNGGTFSGGYAITSPAYMTVKGGTYDVNPTAYVAEGYNANDNGDGTWTVSMMQ